MFISNYFFFYLKNLNTTNLIFIITVLKLFLKNINLKKNSFGGKLKK